TRGGEHRQRQGQRQPGRHLGVQAALDKAPDAGVLADLLGHPGDRAAAAGAPLARRRGAPRGGAGGGRDDQQEDYRQHALNPISGVCPTAYAGNIAEPWLPKTPPPSGTDRCPRRRIAAIGPPATAPCSCGRGARCVTTPGWRVTPSSPSSSWRWWVSRCWLL